jgi:hypothetical protein
MLYEDYYRKGSVGKTKSLAVSLKGLDAETNWLAVNRQSWSNFDFDFDFARLDWRIRIGEFGRVLEGRHSKVIGQEMARRFPSDSKW